MGSIDIYALTGVINHFWLSALSDEHIKKQIGLKYLSTMWDSNPYWYIWFTDKKGVYKLELSQLQELPGLDWSADFKVKYYPHLDESWFDGLSKLEKLARLSPVFDSESSFGEGCCHGQHHAHDQCGHQYQGEHQCGQQHDLSVTGVPIYEYASNLPDDFYYAGNLNITFKAESGTSLKLKTQNYWRVIMLEDYKITDENGDVCDTLVKGSVDRDYPGHEIMDFIYRRMVYAWQRIYNYRFYKNKVWNGLGICFKTDGEALIQEKSSDIEMLIEQTELKFQKEELNIPLDKDIETYNLTLCKGGEVSYG